MKLSEYFADKGITLCFIGLGGLLFAAAAGFAGVAGQLILFFALLYICIVLTWLLLSFFIIQRRIHCLDRVFQELPDKYLLGEILPAPKSSVERQYYRILKEVSRSAVATAEMAVRDKEAYCDYVESWIHEIKTPLTACSLILANDGDCKKLKTELKRADNLTESILYYARLRTAEKDTQIRKAHAADIISTAVKSQMELMIAARICVEIQGDFLLYTDCQAVGFMIKQLLINAAKYCPGCAIQITAEDGHIIVEDNGVGIPDYELHRVTERGFTGAAGRKLGGGTGMGLYIVRELCERLDVGLRIDSKVGAYTRITLSFGNITKL